jgi:hypothetical protein
MLPYSVEIRFELGYSLARELEWIGKSRLAAPMCSEPEATKKAKNRADFIRRLFAVTVSVGFANQLIQMEWIKKGRWPEPTEAPHILFLLVGLFLIIQSWDGYFAALQKCPLERKSRFYIDTIIVLSYLVLLTVTNAAAAFLLVVCAIFILYMIWDFLTFNECFKGYEAPNGSFGTYACQIAAAARNKQSKLRSKLSTIVAFLWFLEIYGIYLQRKDVPFYLYLTAVFVGLCMYRWDQSAPRRFLIIFAPILIAGATFVYVAIWR